MGFRICFSFVLFNSNFNGLGDLFWNNVFFKIMITKLTKNDLINFEEDILKCFENKEIRAPIHLNGNSEDILIDYFNKNVSVNDWILTTWRSHYQILLKGVPPELVKKSILEGKSISLCFPEYKCLSSAIVGGIIPIAVGLGLSIKMKNKKEKVHAFVGDMASLTGTFDECLRYVTNHDLPVKYVIENNKKSVCTPTYEVWNIDKHPYEGRNDEHVFYYEYELNRNHAGGKTRTQF